MASVRRSIDDFICFYSEGGLKDEDMSTNAPTPRQEDTEALLREGISAAKSGQRDRARELLTHVVEQDEENTLAWLWLSSMVDSLADREVCLENVLALDPDNDAARRGLAILRRQRLDRSLSEGISAARSGQRDRARELLTHVVEQDEENVHAWLWLSGVADSLDERVVCLENVLALDPGNEAAQRGLSIVQAQQRGQPSFSAEVESTAAASTPETAQPPSAAAHTRSPAVVEPEARAPRRAQKPPSYRQNGADSYPAADPADRLFPDPAVEAPALFSAVPEPESVPLSLFGQSDEEYLCPYCAAMTEPEDRRCKKCHNKLWIESRKQEKRSVWLWIALVLQALSTLPLLVLPLMLAFILFAPEGNEVSTMISGMMDVYTGLLGVSSAVVETWAIIGFIVTLVLSLVAGIMLIGLYLRWRIAFYLFLVGAALSLFWTVANVIMSFSPDSAFTLAGGSSLVSSSVNVIVALARLMLAFQIQDDFEFDRERILLCLDPDVSNGSMILARGHEYAGRKMWAMAALHMRRAVLAMPNQAGPRIALTLAYIRLARYDLAARSLAEARRISPDDAHVQELQTVLDELRTGDGQT
jgi:tetratricopeptide (TPR) repeat protein